MWMEAVLVILVSIFPVSHSETCHKGVSFKQIGLDVSLTAETDLKCTWPKHCCYKTVNFVETPSCCFHLYFWLIIGGLFLFLVILIPLICCCVSMSSNRVENTVIIPVRPYPGFHPRQPVQHYHSYGPHNQFPGQSYPAGMHQTYSNPHAIPLHHHPQFNPNTSTNIPPVTA